MPPAILLSSELDSIALSISCEANCRENAFAESSFSAFQEEGIRQLPGFLSIELRKLYLINLSNHQRIKRKSGKTPFELTAFLVQTEAVF